MNITGKEQIKNKQLFQWKSKHQMWNVTQGILAVN